MVHGLASLAGVLDAGKVLIDQTGAALRKAFEPGIESRQFLGRKNDHNQVANQFTKLNRAFNNPIKSTHGTR